MTDKIGRNPLTEVMEVNAQISNTRRRRAAAVIRASRARSSKIAALTEVRDQDYCKHRD